ncbi:hypothetical protein [Verrucosispora sioxanthis]|uniref:Uncharacterized protein n=1 Tax=Verrucosispora sioxanthis TaxID=2499994 RepID=A0A6M1LD70_9ACTN|nr:hypothetical protein [Verrucosispora sioxanthis]NEE67145.1 hypothetical protein [Verrucosispora sioxanthis]NGM16255.1 hypothetical protein [Verrucosispora sioxanthis]
MAGDRRDECARRSQRMPTGQRAAGWGDGLAHRGDTERHGAGRHAAAYHATSHRHAFEPVIRASEHTTGVAA